MRNKIKHRQKCKTGKSPTPSGKISIGELRRGASSVNDWNLTLGCRRFPCLALLPVLDSICLLLFVPRVFIKPTICQIHYYNRHMYSYKFTLVNTWTINLCKSHASGSHHSGLNINRLWHDDFDWRYAVSTIYGLDFGTVPTVWYFIMYVLLQHRKPFTLETIVQSVPITPKISISIPADVELLSININVIRFISNVCQKIGSGRSFSQRYSCFFLFTSTNRTYHRDIIEIFLKVETTHPMTIYFVWIRFDGRKFTVLITWYIW